MTFVMQDFEVAAADDVAGGIATSSNEPGLSSYSSSASPAEIIQSLVRNGVAQVNGTRELQWHPGSLLSWNHKTPASSIVMYGSNFANAA